MNEENKKGLQLDGEALKLYEALGGIEQAAPVKPDTMALDLAEALGEEERRIDAWRVRMVELAHTLGALVGAGRLGGSLRDQERGLAFVTQTLDELVPASSRNRVFMIHFRGRGAGAAEGLDYIIKFAHISVDLAQAKLIARRRGVGLSHLPGRAAKAFEGLAKADIDSLHLDLGQWTKKDRQDIARALAGLGRYYQALAALEAQGTGISSPGLGIVRDEFNRPDPNLSLLADFNGVKPAAIQALAGKVQKMMESAETSGPLARFVSVYEAIFAFKKLKEQLARPPVEVNNAQWLLAGRESGALNPERARVGRLVRAGYGDAPQKAVQVLESVYGEDFESIDPVFLEKRLTLVNGLLKTIESQRAGAALGREVLGSVSQRLDLVEDEVMEALVVRGDQPGAAGPARLHERLLDLVGFFKHRVATKRKIHQMLSASVDFDAQDYETIARDFGILPADARRLLELLKSCFNPEGRFLRAAFERNIPEFARYEKKVFEFLWYYLNAIIDRDDRVAFLNALQFLIDRMDRPAQALEVLLKDFWKNPAQVAFSNRNNLMLGSVLLRRYNKELKNDIEITPEEVLLVRDGLDEGVTQAARLIVERERERLFAKLGAVHQRLKQALAAQPSSQPAMPAPYLITLERELYIFLALIGGPQAHIVLKNALGEYGDPGAEIYRLEQSRRFLKQLWPLLQVAARGVGRFGEPGDIPALQRVQLRGEEMLALAPGPREAEIGRRALTWVGDTLAGIL